MKKLYGVDFGAENIRLVSADSGIIITQPAVAAYDYRSGRIVGFGNAAIALSERLPGAFRLGYPFESMSGLYPELLSGFIGCLFEESGVNPGKRYNLAVSLPCERDSAADNLVLSAGRLAGAGEIFIADNMTAAFRGSDAPENSDGIVVVNIGASKLFAGVVRNGEIESVMLTDNAGVKFNRALSELAASKYGVILDRETAEYIKTEIGTVDKHHIERSLSVKGVDSLLGIPRLVSVSGDDIYDTFMRVTDDICDDIIRLVRGEHITPECIYLTGGTALLEGLSGVISDAAGIEVRVNSHPEQSVARGLVMLMLR